MAYHDHQPGTHNQPYNDQYNDTEYNPYAPHNPVGAGYHDTGYTGYRDETFVPPGAQLSDDDDLARPAQNIPSEKAPYGHQRAPSYGNITPPKSSGDLRMWRHDEHGNVWTKGSRGRCFGRFFCCTLMIFVLLLLGIIGTIGLWIRPPNITFNGVILPTTNQVTATTDGFTIKLNLNITVDNPNFFSATFKNISAAATYPVGNASNIGGGSLSNVNFASHSNSELLFPFAVTYDTSEDPSFVIAKDLATKCGILGGSKSNIVVDYVLTLKITILATISPSFKSSASFPCPLTEDELKGFAGGLFGGSS